MSECKQLRTRRSSGVGPGWVAPCRCHTEKTSADSVDCCKLILDYWRNLLEFLQIDDQWPVVVDLFARVCPWQNGNNCTGQTQFAHCISLEKLTICRTLQHDWIWCAVLSKLRSWRFDHKQSQGEGTGYHLSEQVHSVDLKLLS